MTVRFDPVRGSDADALARLARNFHAEDGHQLTDAGEAALRQVAQGEPLARAWLVREHDAVLGYLIITLGYSIEYGGRDGFIDDLYLVPAARGRGLGRMLLDFALGRRADSASARCTWRSNVGTMPRCNSTGRLASATPDGD